MKIKHQNQNILKEMSAFKYGSYLGLLGSGSVLGSIIERKRLKSQSQFRPKEIDSKFKRGEEIVKYGTPKLLSENTILYNSNHVLQYDGRTRTPFWVAEHITKDHINPQNSQHLANRKKSKFRTDPRLAQLVQADNQDFWDSGWSRGHMAPAGNNKHDQDSMNDTFYLSNIVAQDFDNNGDFWNRFESFGRNLTKKFNDVRIISGPLWIPILEEDQAEQINKFNGRPLKKHKIMTYPVSHFLPANM